MAFELNPNIPMSYQFGPSPLEQVSKVMTIADMLDKRKMNQLQIAQAEQDAAAQKTIRGIYQKDFERMSQPVPEVTAPDTAAMYQQYSQLQPDTATNRATLEAMGATIDPGRPAIGNTLPDFMGPVQPQPAVPPSIVNMPTLQQFQAQQGIAPIVEQRQQQIQAQQQAQAATQVPEMYKNLGLDANTYKNYLQIGAMSPAAAQSYLKDVTEGQLKATEMAKNRATAQFYGAKGANLTAEGVQKAKEHAATLAYDLLQIKSPAAQQALYGAMYASLVQAGQDVSKIPAPEDFDATNPQHMGLVQAMASAGRTMQQKAEGERKTADQLRTDELNRMRLSEQMRLDDAKIWALTHPQARAAGGLNAPPTPEEVNNINQAITNGLDPKWLNSRTVHIFAALQAENPDRRWTDVHAQAVFQSSSAVNNTRALLQAITGTGEEGTGLFEKLLESGKQLNNTNFPLVNRAINWTKEQAGDPKIVQFNNQRDDLIAEVERGLLGTGVLSDSKYLRALHNVNSAQSYPQLEAAVKAMKTVITERIRAIESGPYPKSRTGGEQPQPGAQKKPGKMTKEEFARRYGG